MTITMLMMLIKHCVSDHCNGIANKDLSANEKYNLIMDKGEEPSSLSSVRGVTCAPAFSSAFSIPSTVVNTDTRIEIYDHQECLLFPP